MDERPPGRRIAGTLRFLAELQSVAAECAAAGAWNDELSSRRRQRDEVRFPEIRGEERQVEAL
jgi:hypothetical protein